MLARQAAGLEAKLRARTTRQKQRVLKVMEASGDRVLNAVAILTPFDTGFMLEKLRLERTRGGYNYAVGWRSADFIGQVNSDGRPITTFYPVYVVGGTRFMIGRDPLTPALQAEQPGLTRELVKALGA